MIYLHLGVHKTATTYLQDLFELNQGRIAGAGRAYWTREQFRPLIQWGLRAGEMSGRHPLVRRVLRPRVERVFVRQIRDLLAVPMPSIISEENIIGNVADALDGWSYIHARERLDFMARVIAGRETEIWLCARDYASFLSSQYAEALRHGYDVPIDRFVETNRVADGRWPELVGQVHEAFPRARIVVWRYEDFRALEPVIIARLTGLDPEEMLALPANEVRQSPSRRAVELQSDRLGGMQSAERRLSMAMLEDSFPLRAHPGKFDPWDDRTRDEMRAAYQRDMAAIAEHQYVEMLSAGPAPS